jgi:hypothetical protein
MTTVQPKRKNIRIPDPTPEEIRTRAAEIRRTWGTLEDTKQQSRKEPSK